MLALEQISQCFYLRISCDAEDKATETEVRVGRSIFETSRLASEANY